MKKYTKEEIRKANEADLVELLLFLGVSLKKSGREFELAEHDSCKISRFRGFYWHSQGFGGGVIDFLMSGAAVPTIPKMSFLESMETVFNFLGIKKEGIARITENKENKHIVNKGVPREHPKKEKKGKFQLPKRAGSNARLFAYLVKTRGISPKIIKTLINAGLIYESVNHNVVFIGNKNEGGKIVPAFAQERGTNTNIEKRFVHTVDYSDFRHTFMIEGVEGTGVVYVFESPIDAISYIDINKKEMFTDTYLSLCGTSLQGLNDFLARQDDIKNIVICVDNDNGGKKLAAKIKDTYESSYTIKTHLPKHKDWNEDLTRKRKKEKEIHL